MIHKNLTPFFWGPRVTSRTARRIEMAVCVRAVFAMARDGSLAVIEDPMEQGFLSGDTFAEDDIDQRGPLVHADDFAEWKLHGEFLVRGHCHPGAGPTTGSTVTMTVGAASKTLRVHGPRVFRKGRLFGGTAGDPQPFAKMPLDWAHTYGGPGYDANPVGRGHSGEELPTVELPDSPIRKIGQSKAAPATFLPISPHWPQRAGKRGRNYGPQWRKTRAPFYSDDFDWTYFQSAAADQWIEGYWRGDEPLRAENLVPGVPVWESRLPGIRLRAFAKTADAVVHEPAMHLDTVYADFDDEKLYLTWRGHVPIGQLDMSDVAAVLIAQEPLDDEPAAASIYVEQLAEFEADPVGLKSAFPAGFMMFAEAVEAAEAAELHDLPKPDLHAVAENLPEDCPFPPWFLGAVAGDPDPLGVRSQFPPGMLEGDPAMGQAAAGGLADPANQAKLFEDLAKIADTPEFAPTALQTLAALLPPDKQAPFQEGVREMTDSLARLKEVGGDDLFTRAAEAGKNAAAPKPHAVSYGEMMDQAFQGLDQRADLAITPDSASMVTDARAKLGSAPRSLDDAVAEALKPLESIELPDVPDIPDVAGQLAEHTAELEQQEARMRAKFGDHPMLGMFELGRGLIANAPTPGAIAPDLSPLVAGLQEAQDQLAAQGISSAALAPLAAVTAKVSGLVDKIPKPPPLPEGEFVARDLRGKDFSQRDLRGEAFCRSNLAGAKFVGADLTGADLRWCDLTGADLTGAQLSDARLHDAILTKAMLADVVAHRAGFDRADLATAVLRGADLSQATLKNCKAAEVDLHSTRLAEADLRFADLSKADLRDAVLTAADLSFAILNLVKADRADFTAAKLDLARLTRSRLQRAVLRETRCSMGQFTGSDLTGADAAAADYEKVDFMNCVLDDASFRDAKLRHLQLRDVVAHRTDFRNADLDGCSSTGDARYVDCDFRHARGERSVWMTTDLSGSNFRHARMPRAWFDGAHGDDVDFTAAVLTGANFRKAALSRPSFAFADLAGAVFQQAELDDADFRRSNCYDAKFLGARSERCRFDDAFVVGVQVDDPPPADRSDDEPSGDEQTGGAR